MANRWWSAADLRQLLAQWCSAALLLTHTHARACARARTNARAHAHAHTQQQPSCGPAARWTGAWS